MVKTKTYQYKLNSLNRAIESYGKSLSIELESKVETEADAIKNGQALKFSFTIELLWKTIKSYLYTEHGVECNSPKSCIKSFYINVNLDEEDYERLLDMIDQRNELSHIYDQKKFDEIWSALKPNLEVIERVAAILRA